MLTRARRRATTYNTKHITWRNHCRPDSLFSFETVSAESDNNLRANMQCQKHPWKRRSREDKATKTTAAACASCGAVQEQYNAAELYHTAWHTNSFVPVSYHSELPALLTQFGGLVEQILFSGASRIFYFFLLINKIQISLRHSFKPTQCGKLAEQILILSDRCYGAHNKRRFAMVCLNAASNVLQPRT